MAEDVEAADTSQLAGSANRVSGSLRREGDIQPSVFPMLTFINALNNTAESAGQADRELTYENNFARRQPQPSAIVTGLTCPGDAPYAAGRERLDRGGYLRPVDEFVEQARTDVAQPERGLSGIAVRTQADIFKEEPAPCLPPRKEIRRQSCNRAGASSRKANQKFVLSNDGNKSSNGCYQSDLAVNRPSYCHCYCHPATVNTHKSTSPRTESPYSLAVCKNCEVRSDHVCLSHKIGGGAFGQVWKALALDLDPGQDGWSPVAIKMLNGK